MSEWMANTIGVFVIVFLVIATIADLIVSAILLNLIGHVLHDKHDEYEKKHARKTPEERQPVNVG